VAEAVASGEAVGFEVEEAEEFEVEEEFGEPQLEVKAEEFEAVAVEKAFWLEVEKVKEQTEKIWLLAQLLQQEILNSPKMPYYTLLPVSPSLL